jgi:hypothetical protein
VTKEKIGFFVGGGLFVLATAFAGCYVRERTIEKGFARVSLGDPEAQVTKYMGRPSAQGPCGQVAGFFYPASNCGRELVYRDPFHMPAGYIVLFNPAGRVMQKEMYSSP